tara:strand:- start:46 stop:414 length:369 start_codon:yes stop_codon:yes gene_type:complete
MVMLLENVDAADTARPPVIETVPETAMGTLMSIKEVATDTLTTVDVDRIPGVSMSRTDTPSHTIPILCPCGTVCPEPVAVFVLTVKEPDVELRMAYPLESAGIITLTFPVRVPEISRNALRA